MLQVASPGTDEVAQALQLKSPRGIRVQIPEVQGPHHLQQQVMPLHQLPAAPMSTAGLCHENKQHTVLPLNGNTYSTSECRVEYVLAPVVMNGSAI